MVIVYLNGKYLDEQKAFVSIYDAGFLYGEAVYETLRTRGGKVENVEAHLKRLEQSARTVGIAVPARAVLRKALQGVVDRNDFGKKGQGEARLRLTVSGGMHGFDDDSVTPTVLITAVPLPEMSRVKSRGVSAISFRVERFMPSIKTTHLLPTLLARRAMRKAKAYEVLLVDHRGFATEGSISNFFWVKGKKLYTPKSNILAGTTREQVFAAARRLKIPVIERDVRLAALYAADELFVCNAPRGIVPVVRLDGRRIGGGKVGEATKKITSSTTHKWVPRNSK